MAAGLVVPVSGPYVGTWDAKPFGTLSDDGYEIRATVQGQEVNETDAFGMTLVEGIYRGINWRALLRGLEWKPGLLDLLQMFGQTGASGSLTPSLANIGNRWTLFSKTMLLTAILGNPPSTPVTLTALTAGLAPNSMSSFLMTSKVRELPLEVVLIPYSSGGSAISGIPFSTT